MEDQIIGVAVIVLLLAAIGIDSIKSKRRFGENPVGSKYSKRK